MDFQKLYQSKLVTADEVAGRVQSGWLMCMDAGPAQADGIMAALCNRARQDSLTGVKVMMILDVYPFEFLTGDSLNGKINAVSWFSGGGCRKAVNAGIADFVPNYYRDIPGLIRTYYDYDACCISVSPMDRHGFFSLGCTGSFSEAMIAKSKHIYVEVNENQPRALGNTQLHISQIEAVVENTHALPILPSPILDETSKTIGSIIAEQISDGACIQLGIGAIPDATGKALSTKHDLGIHTEMFTDSMVGLIECGAVNNSRKQLHRGKTVTTFTYGSQRIYDYVHDNPAFLILPVDYVNNPEIISQNDNFVSINSAIEVDIMGQVCAESVGTKHMSGTGGQVDYVRGAVQSKGGQSFIAIESTAKNGTISKIVPTLAPGAAVTTSKNDVDCVVTEYGIARLRGRSLADRTKALIAIAHPNFRDQLTFEAKKRGIMV